MVIPQYLARLRFLRQLERLAAATGVDLYEIVLLDTRTNSLRRWAAREALAAEAGPTPPTVRDDEDGERIGQMYDRLMALLECRPNAILIPTEQGKIKAAYRALLDRLEPAAG